MSEPRTAAWWQERMENALDRLVPAIERAHQNYAPDGYTLDAVPLTWGRLLSLPFEQALDVVERMTQHPEYAAEGMRYKRMLIERLEKQGDGD